MMAISDSSSTTDMDREQVLSAPKLITNLSEHRRFSTEAKATAKALQIYRSCHLTSHGVKRFTDSSFKLFLFFVVFHHVVY